MNDPLLPPSLDMSSANHEEAFQRALSAYKAMDWMVAERLCLELIEQDRLYADALNLLGIISAASWDHTSAVSWFQRAVDANTDAAGYWVNLGVSLLKLGKTGDAKEAFLHSLKLDPSNEISLFSLGEICLIEGAIEPAKEYLRDCLSYAPHHNDARSHLIAILGEQALDAATVSDLGALYGYAAQLAALGSTSDAQAAYQFIAEQEKDDLNLLIQVWVKCCTTLDLAFDPTHLKYKIFEQIGSTNIGQLVPILEDKLDLTEKLQLAGLLLEMGKNDDAERLYKRLVLLNPTNGAAISTLAAFYQSKGQADEAIALLHGSLNPANPDKEILEAYLSCRASYKKSKPLPAILLNTLPKSGSVYIATTLKEGLGIEWQYISYSYGELRLDIAKEISTSGNVICQEHLTASMFDPDMMELFPKMILHLRDPRQAMLSATHYLDFMGMKTRIQALDQKLESGIGFVNYANNLPDDYPSWSLTQRIDYSITNYYPIIVGWMADWMEFIDHQRGMEILVTTYDDFTRDSDDFFAKILDFYGIPKELFLKKELEKSMKFNFRKGGSSEWRDALTPRQIARVNELTPSSLFGRFNWVP